MKGPHSSRRNVAAKAWIDALAKAQESTGHSGASGSYAEAEKRFADYTIMALSGILWPAKEKGVYEQGSGYIGEEKHPLLIRPNP